MAASMNEGEQFPANYVMKVPAGGFLGGLVVDEQQQPVANVKIEFDGPGIDIKKRENQEFGPDTIRYTDETGRWWSDTVPTDLDSVRVLLIHPDFAATETNLSGDNPDLPSMLLVIRKGVLVRGMVADQSGLPIAGATVRQAENRIEPLLSAKSDETGRFELGRWNQRELTLAVQAKGFSPVVLKATLSNNPSEIDFRLAPGLVLRGRVVDESGVGVTNATIRTEMDSLGVREIQWSGKTDREGKFEWKSAPAEALNYSFEAEGFSAASQSLQANETEHEIRLKHGKASQPGVIVRLRGTVMDADTGQPLDQFKVLVGRMVMPGDSPQFRFGTDGKDGQFDFRNNSIFMGPAYQVEVQKDGYAPAVSTNLLVKDGDQILMFNLHKDAGLKGEVLLPNGDAATNATVFLYQSQGGVYMDRPGGFLKGSVTSALHAQADIHGRFSFAAVLEPCGFIAFHDQGYADVPIGSFNGTITLQPWGRVQGKLSVAGRSGAGQRISLHQVSHRYYGNGRRFAPLQLWLETTTDGDGNFVFEKVPPGERLVSQRLIRTGSELGRIYDTQEKPITVTAGTVTQVELGGSGTTVKGRASLAGATHPVNWPEVAAELSLKVAGAPGTRPKPEDFPSRDAFLAASQSYADAQRAFWSSEKGHQFERENRSYAAYCAEDGSFSIPDVPQGQYELTIDIHDRTSSDPINIDGKPVGLLDKEINVPESADGKDHQVLDLGTLEVPPVKVSQGAGLQFIYAR